MQHHIVCTRSRYGHCASAWCMFCSKRTMLGIVEAYARVIGINALEYVIGSKG